MMLGRLSQTVFCAAVRLATLPVSLRSCSLVVPVTLYSSCNTSRATLLKLRNRIAFSFLDSTGRPDAVQSHRFTYLP